MTSVDAKNNCQFIMNPDEADLNLVFRSKQMTSGKTAAASAENRAWFTYENFSRVNNNQIRNLRKQLKDGPSAPKWKSRFRTRKWNSSPSSTS